MDSKTASSFSSPSWSSCVDGDAICRTEEGFGEVTLGEVTLEEVSRVLF